jgi:hypothetical protein
MPLLTTLETHHFTQRPKLTRPLPRYLWSLRSPTTRSSRRTQIPRRFLTHMLLRNRHLQLVHIRQLKLGMPIPTIRSQRTPPTQIHQTHLFPHVLEPTRRPMLTKPPIVPRTLNLLTFWINVQVQTIFCIHAFAVL